MNTDDDCPYSKYLIRFYHDDSEVYKVLEELRLLPPPMKGVVPGLGASVYCRYNDGAYYKGRVKKIHDYKVLVDIFEKDDELEHDNDDPSAIILNMVPRETQVKIAFKVIAYKKGHDGLHPGKVASIKGQKHAKSYWIRFEDGSQNQVELTQLRLMPKAPFDCKYLLSILCLMITIFTQKLNIQFRPKVY